MSVSQDKPFDLFVSYAAADRAWVEGFLLDGLRAAGVRCLTPSGYDLGADWGSEFERAVRQSRRVLLVLSAAYLADVKQREQAGLAYFNELETEGVSVIPLHLHEVEVPLRLRQKVSLRAVTGAEQAEALERLARVCETGPPADGKQPSCPYPGMEAFDRNQAEQFHGRRREVEELLQELRYRSCLFLIGGSGSGKSSLVFAGLLPRLEQGRTVHVMRPGPTPAARLAALTADVAGPCLLVVDQFEEVYTRATAEESRRFQEALAVWMAGPERLLVATVRADFFLDLQNSPAIFPLFRDNRRDVLKLDRAGLREAIEGPAAGVGVFVEPALVERLLADAADELCVLPHLQATLQLLWDKRRRRYLPLEAYLELGREGKTGLQLALALEADRAVRGFKEEELAVARRTLLRLVQFGEGREDTRRQQPHAALESAGEPDDVLGRVLARLILHRLVVPGEVRVGADTVKVYDLAHEALITGWPRLQEWVRQYRAAEQTRRRLEGRAAEWVRLGRGAGGLFAEEVELREAEDWLSQYGGEMGARADLRELLRASRAKLEADRAAARRRVRRTLVGLTTALLVVSGLAIWGGMNAYNAYREAHVANAQLTEKAIDEGDLSNARKLLSLQLPGRLPFQSDLRGFEWYYWWRLCHRQRHTLAGHDYEVRGVAFTDDHTLLSATGEWNRQRVQVKRWRVSPGEERDLNVPLGNIVLDGEFVDALAVSPDGRTLAYGTAYTDPARKDYRVTLRALDSERPAEALAGTFPDRIGCLAFSPDGRRLAAAARNGGDVRVWDTAEPRRDGRCFSVRGSVRTLALNNRGWLAIALDERHLMLFMGGPHMEATALGVDITCLAFARGDDRVLAAGTSAGAIYLWDLGLSMARPPLIDPVSTRKVTCLAFAPNGPYLAAGGEDNKVRLWDATSGILHDTFTGHGGALTALAFSPGGKTLASGGADHAVRLWDLPDPARLETPWPRRPCWTLKVVSSPDGREMVTTDSDDHARLWDAATGRVTRAFAHTHLALALSPAGDLLVTGGKCGVIKLWDVASGERLQELVFGGEDGNPAYVTALAFADDGTLAVGGDSGLLRLFRLQARALTATDRHARWHDGSIYQLAYSPKNGELVSASNDGTVLLWSKDLVPRLRIFAGEPDARACGRVVHQGDTLTQKVNLSPEASREVWSVAFAPGGDALATACGDGLVRVWDAQTGCLREEFRGHVGKVYGVAFSPNGSTLASGGADATVKLWSLRTGRLHATLRGHGNEPVRALAFAAPDDEGQRHSRLLVSVSRDPVNGGGTVRFWRAATAQDLQARGE
jgi:WD40 repeat protein